MVELLQHWINLNKAMRMLVICWIYVHLIILFAFGVNDLLKDCPCIVTAWVALPSSCWYYTTLLKWYSMHLVSFTFRKKPTLQTMGEHAFGLASFMFWISFVFICSVARSIPVFHGIFLHIWFWFVPLVIIHRNSVYLDVKLERLVASKKVLVVKYW